MNPDRQTRILGVGVATLDIVNSVEDYPAEDEEVRATAQQRQRGGNASNTLVVLATLGHACEWLGVLADDAEAGEIVADLERHGVGHAHCPVITDGCSPVSWVIRNTRTGSRTIIHHRRLPELHFDQFAAIALQDFDWIHFEGREPDEVARMIGHARMHSGARISVEIEKPRTGIEMLYRGVDLLLFSRAYARALGHDSADDFLSKMAERIPATHLVCAWGEQGASAIPADGSLFEVPATPPERVIDTLGAGDVFNAGVIDALVRGQDLQAAVTAGCRLAGDKCGHTGLLR